MWVTDLAVIHADGTQIPIYSGSHQVNIGAYGVPPEELGASAEYVADSTSLDASAPDGALHMSGNVTSTALFAGQSWALDISGSLHNYTIRSGDKLVLRQKQATGVQGVFLSMWANCANAANSHNQYLFDQNAESMQASSVFGTWQERTFDLSPSLNCVPQSVRVGHWQSAATGPWEMWLGDMLIRSTDGRETPIYAGWWQAGAYPFNNIQPSTELGGTAVYDATATGNSSGGSGSGSGGSSGSSGSGGSGSSGSSGSTTTAATTTFYVTDHLGTASLEFSATGALLWQGEFAPFGGELDMQLTTNRYKFTGKERDTESGLDYFGARMYASTMGRFVSPDPSGLYYADPANPQSLNLYSYAQNNSLKNTDPTGLDCVYFNDAGNAAESIDQHSNSDECGKNGGDWVNGRTSASQVSYNQQNDTFNIKSSDTFHNYSSTVQAPGSQTDGTDCFGNCSTANGYSQSLKWPNFTLQLGLAANVSFFGPFTGGTFTGVAIDSHGHVGGYYGGGGGLGLGAGGAGGVQLAISDGKGICALGGPFGNVSVTGGAGVAGTLDGFAGRGDGPGGSVTGVGVTLGGGGGLGGSATVTGTTVVPFGHTQCAGGMTK